MRTRIVRGGPASALVVPLAAVLAGCSSPLPTTLTPSDPISSTAPVMVPASCPAPRTPAPGDTRPPILDKIFGDPGPAGGIPTDFTVRLALDCLPGGSFAPSGETRRPDAVERRLTTRLDELLAALRRPSQRPRPDPPCSAIATRMPHIILVGTDGQAIRPAIPRNSCGQPQQQILDVLDALPWQPTGASARPAR